MTRLIDADRFIAQLEDQYMEHDITRSEYVTLEDRIMQQPIVDAVPVIRCRDCALSRKTVTKDVVVCIRHGFGTHEDPDGYCYKAKRKGGNDE